MKKLAKGCLRLVTILVMGIVLWIVVSTLIAPFTWYLRGQMATPTPISRPITPSPAFSTKLQVIEYVQNYHLPAEDRITIQERTFMMMTYPNIRAQSIGWTAERRSDSWYVQWQFATKTGSEQFAEWRLNTRDGSVSNANVWAEQITPQVTAPSSRSSS